jgi:gliding motility-associated-like protein
MALEETVKDDLIINVYPKPEFNIKATPLKVTIPDHPVSFFSNLNGNYQFLWDFGDGNTSSENSPAHKYEKPGNYKVRLDVENEYGCTTFDTLNSPIIAIAGGQINFPNAFTPNPSGPSNGLYDIGEENNYIFYPSAQKGIVEYQLQIFSRWGQLLFESNDIRIGWDGYYKDKLMSQGVYIWKVTCRFSTGEVKVFTGDVTLLR